MLFAYFVYIAHLTNIHSWKLFAYEKIFQTKEDKEKIFDHDIKLEIMRYILWFVLIRDAAYFSFIQNL